VLTIKVTFQRLARQPLTLSDGTEIPAGTMAFSPAQAINFDPEIYPNAETFDGLRFYNLRQASAENEKKFQLTSITKEQMQFGIGRHACPGRWLASHQIKLVLAGLIEKYEFKLKTGEGRPKTILFQTNQLPDPNAEILFKNRK
jgi:cytochrome P450